MSWFNEMVAQTLPVIPKPIVRKVSSRYIAGEDLGAATAKVRELNAGRMTATMDVLGESVNAPEMAREASRRYLEVLSHIDAEGFDSNVSMKPTQLGLAIDRELCYENIRTVVEKAAGMDNFVRIDMEDSGTTDATLEVFERIRSEFPAHVGIVIQAYLKRSLEDVRSLASRRANVRLCKGIYIEPAEIAYKGHGEINDNFVLLLGELLRGGSYVGIATHDEALVEASYRLVDELGLTPEQYEFQMLLGVAEKLRARIVAGGHRLRVYVPFGRDWYAYSVRRLQENPAIAGHIIKNMFNEGL